MKNFLKLLALSLSLLFIKSSFAYGLRPEFFQVDEEMKKRVEFWKKIYTITSSDQGFLHDPDDLSVVYELITLTGMSPKQQTRYIKDHKEKIKNTLLAIAYKGKENLTEEESQHYLTVAYKSPEEIKILANKIRWQRGMSDRFRQGLVDSTLYLERIKNIFKEEGVPEELAYLPHVESSFNYRAYSKVGAAGIWQFMRATARLYRLKMNYVVDERLDPLIAARSAAKLLKSNYLKLGAWPLAITAYNHGPHGMERAAQSLSTTNISEIIKNYEGNRFGFASQNFYACFVAAYELAQAPEKYFGNIGKSSGLKFNSWPLERALTIKQITQITGVDAETLKIFNRSFRPVAFTSQVPIPKNTVVHLPEDTTNMDELRKKVVNQKEEIPPIESGTSTEHIIANGESLYTISQIYKVSLNDLIEINHLINPRSLKIGNKIKIPSSITVTSAANPTSPSLTPLAVASQLPSIPIIVDKVFTAPSLPDDVIKNYQLELKKISKNQHRLTVEANESLGQYAEWLDVSVDTLKKINGMGKKFVLRIGQKLKLPLVENGVYEFNLKRVQYHLALEEDFYANFKIVDVEIYKVKRGDSLLLLSEKKQIPLWLMKKYIPLHQQSIRQGQTLTLPKITPIDITKVTPLDETTADN